MSRVVKQKVLAGMLTTLLGAGVCGCSLSDDTVSSLVDLAATTSGGFVEIVVRSTAECLMSLGVLPDLNAPLSEQHH